MAVQAPEGSLLKSLTSLPFFPICLGLSLPLIAQQVLSQMGKKQGQGQPTEYHAPL